MAVAITRAASRPASTAVVASAEGEASRIGRLLGSYRLVTELGQGGMGTVYYAEHTTLPRRAAVKVLASDIARDPELVRRFFDEAHAANAIRHPGIVDVIDLGSDAGVHYLVMELLEGETIGARLERCRRLDPPEAVRLLAQAADALGAAHERGIVHRDLKPENLFLTRGAGGERVKILDFGIAKLTGRDETTRTRTGTVLGTPVYMSPEQCLGERDLDARSDVYSLGVVAFEMLTGRPPFVADAVGRLIVAHTHEAPPAPTSIEPSIPAALEQVVLRMLAKRRDERFESMRDARQALEEALTTRVPAHLAILQRDPRRSAPSAEEIERIEVAQTKTVGHRLRDILHQRITSDRLPLPSMPMVVMRALDLLRDEGVGMGRIARVLETDPLIVARVLKLANSAALGGSSAITSLDSAIARLGQRRLRALLHECAAKAVFVSRDPAVARSFKSVWEHCVAVGTLARELASDEPPAFREELYLAGLLHDVGKPVVGVLLLETERSLWEKLGAPWMGGSLWLKVVEDCHAEVGASLARKWKLPDAVTAAIGHGLERVDETLPRFQVFLAYAHALAESAGHRGGAVERPEVGFEVERARELLEGSVERERKAVAALAEVLSPGAAPARATIGGRRR